MSGGIFLGTWVRGDIGWSMVLHRGRDLDSAHVSLGGGGPKRCCGNGQPLAGESGSVAPLETASILGIR